MSIRTWLTDISDAFLLADAAGQPPPSRPPRHWTLALALPGPDLDHVLMHAVVATARLDHGLEVLWERSLPGEQLTRPLSRYSGWPVRVARLDGLPGPALRHRLQDAATIRLVVAAQRDAEILGVRESWLPSWWPPETTLNLVRPDQVERSRCTGDLAQAGARP